MLLNTILFVFLYYLCKDLFKRIIGTLVDTMTVDKCYKNQESVQYFTFNILLHCSSGAVLAETRDNIAKKTIGLTKSRFK